MKTLLFFNVAIIFFASILALPFNASGGEITYKTVEEEVFKAGNRCTECHAKGKDEPPLKYGWVKKALKSMSEAEIRDDEWFPMTYCNGPIDDAGKEIILKWVNAGMPE